MATTFAQVAKIAAKISGYKPKIVTDESKPEGVHARFADPTEMLHWYQPTVSLHDGLSRTMASLTKRDAIVP